MYAVFNRPPKGTAKPLRTAQDRRTALGLGLTLPCRSALLLRAAGRLPGPTAEPAEPRFAQRLRPGNSRTARRTNRRTTALHRTCRAHRSRQSPLECAGVRSSPSDFGQRKYKSVSGMTDLSLRLFFAAQVSACVRSWRLARRFSGKCPAYEIVFAFPSLGESGLVRRLQRAMRARRVCARLGGPRSRACARQAGNLQQSTHPHPSRARSCVYCNRVPPNVRTSGAESAPPGLR